MRRVQILLAALLALGSAGCAEAALEPRLVLLLVIDQLRPDRLEDETLEGGLGRLVREGRVYTDAVLDHAFTETCAGHATMLTGHHPGVTGLPGNRYPDLEQGRVIYCVADDAEDAAVFGGVRARGGRSPRKLRVSALGDWLKQADPESRVFTVSGKDRSAIALGGRGADAAYWFNRVGKVGFTSSAYYVDALPDWVAAWNGEDAVGGLFADLPDAWSHDVEADRVAGRPDDFPGESPDSSRISPHPLRDQSSMKFASQLYFSPYLDDLTLDFASQRVEREGLGSGPGTDLLGVSLSATDTIGHRYGPYSHESWAALHQLDRRLAEFIELLESRVGEAGLVVALTADHGVLPLPEWLAAQGRDTCPWDEDRSVMRTFLSDVNSALHRKYSRTVEVTEPWVVAAGSQLGISRPVAKRHGVALEDALATLRAVLTEQPQLQKVWTPAEIRESRDPIARLYRNSIDPERAGDLVLQIPEGCLLSFETGTTHGSPYLYDRRVPLIFWGPGIAAARVPGEVRSIDLGPTLAARVGVKAPPDVEGRVLFD